ncbi:RND transporter family protein [Prauserella flavalba]|uniref:RND transporter n=1 Tax=Prauserella flavalba TaxID=1477506 RepID=A0A318M000_9PSEU|nr:RND transporter [Prauserella flavalba]PXY20545.1 RND transporter [Prauserella flavalba]
MARRGVRRLIGLLRLRVRPTRKGVTIAVGSVLAAGALLGGLARSTMETGVESFLPSGDASVASLSELAGSFGGDPVVVLLESHGERQLLNEDNIEKVLQLEGRLSTLPDVAAVYGPATIVNQIAGQAQKFLAELTGRRDADRAAAQAAAKQSGASDKAAASAGEKAVQAFDARYGPLLVQGLPAGLPTLRNPNFVGTVVYNADGQPRPQWHFVVPSADSIAILVRPREGIEADGTRKLVAGIRQAVADAGIQTKATTVSGVPAVASGVGEQVAKEIPLLGGLAVIAVAACFLCTPWTRRSRRLGPVLTALLATGFTVAVFGWLDRPLSLGVLAFLSVLLGIGAFYPMYFAQRARRRTVLAVAAGTSASFAALMLSPLPFVRDLGLALSVGVLFAALTGLALAPWLAGAPAPNAPGRSSAPLVWPPSTRGVRFGVSAIVVVAAIAGWALLPGLPLRSDFRSFADGLPALADAEHVEQKIGSSGELDIVIRGEDVRSVEAFDWMRRAEATVISAHGEQMQPVVSPVSLLQFLGPAPTGEQLTSALRLLPPYLVGSVIRNDGKVAVLSFGVEINDLGALQRLRDEVLASLPPAPPGYRTELAGLPVVAVTAQDMVSADRIWGNLAGIGAAGIILLIGLRRRSDAVRAVAAGAMATGAGFCALWLTGIPLSPVTVALGSLTTAIGCEFTVLLAEAARRGSRRLLRSVLLATATSAVGYAVLVASRLAVIGEFGLLLAGSVILALLSASCVVAVTVRREHRRPEAAFRPETSKKSTVGVMG